MDRRAARAATRRNKPAFSFLPHGEEIAATLNDEEFDRRARAIAALLRERCAPGDRALLLCPSGLDFLTAFFGFLYAEVVAVTAYPRRANESMRRLAAIIADAGARGVDDRCDAPHLATDTVPDALAGSWRETRIPAGRSRFCDTRPAPRGSQKA